jgi:serine protease Do
VTPLLGKMFKLPDVKGVIITDIFAKGSAEKAGLKRGDVVLRFDGKDVVDSGKLRNIIALVPIGSKHKLDIIRENKPIQAELVIQEAPRERTKRATAIAHGVTMGHPLGGLLVEEITPPVARQLGLSSTTGVVVTAVEEGSLAESAGVSMGDQILEVNRKPVEDLEAYQRLVEPIKPKDLTLLLINRQSTILFVPIEGE